MLTESPTGGDVPLVHDGTVATINVDQDDHDVVGVAGRDLANDVQCVPTQALNAERDLRYAVGFDEEERRTVSIDPQGGEHDPEWQQNVLRGAAIGTSEHRIEESGTHTLRLWALDPGLVVDRIVVYADGERTMYLGPRETSVDD